MGVRNIFQQRYPDDDQPNSWVRMRERLEKNHQKKSNPPIIKAVPEEWKYALIWVFIFTYLNAVQGLIHL